MESSAHVLVHSGLPSLNQGHSPGGNQQDEGQDEGQDTGQDEGRDAGQDTGQDEEQDEGRDARHSRCPGPSAAHPRWTAAKRAYGRCLLLPNCLAAQVSTQRAVRVIKPTNYLQNVN